MQRVILLVVVLCLGAVTAPHITHDDMMLDNEIALNPTAITTALVVGSSIPGSKKDRKPKQPNLQTRWRAENGRNGTKKQVRSCKQLRIPTPVEAASRLNDSLQLNRATSAKEVVKTWIKETLVSLSHISSASTRCDYMLHATLNYGRFKNEEGDNYRSINPLDVAKILEAEIPEVQLTQSNTLYKSKSSKKLTY